MAVTLNAEQMTDVLINLDRITNSLNTAIVALYHIVGVKGDEMDNVKADELVEFTQKSVHPIVRATDKLIREVSEKVAKEAEEAVEPTKEEFEEAEPVESVTPIVDPVSGETVGVEEAEVVEDK